jgi:acyl-CoA thioester hydrolase
MARVEIIIPQKEPLFQKSYTLRVSDMNYGNHLANEKVLAYAQQMRVDYLMSEGFSELDFFGESLIQADAAIHYMSEGFLGDRIEVKLYLGDVSRVSFDFVYDMMNTTTSKPLARLKTGMVCFDYKKRKVRPVPKAFLEKFN